jgi:hypothetical protein
VSEREARVQILITKHARQRFKERIADVPVKLAKKIIRKMLAASVDYRGRHVRFYVNKQVWLHQATGTLFVVNLSVANLIKVVTVMRQRAA